jgi:phosphoribosylformylglycinamidine synthase
LFLARVYVTLKPTVSDPQGQTVLATLSNLGFDTATDIRVGKYLEVRINEADRSRADSLVNRMCETLLANPVIEEFRYDLEPIQEEDGA